METSGIGAGTSPLFTAIRTASSSQWPNGTGSWSTRFTTGLDWLMKILIVTCVLCKRASSINQRGHTLANSDCSRRSRKQSGGLAQAFNTAPCQPGQIDQPTTKCDCNQYTLDCESRNSSDFQSQYDGGLLGYIWMTMVMPSRSQDTMQGHLGHLHVKMRF